MLSKFSKKYIGYFLFGAAALVGNVMCSQEEDYEAQAQAERINERRRAKLLFDAITQGDLPTVQRIFSEDEARRVFARDPRNNTPLHAAAFFGHVPIVQYLLQQPYVDVNAENTWRETPLHSALRTESREGENFTAIEIDCDYDEDSSNDTDQEQDDEGVNCNLDIIKLLLEHGAGIDEEETWGAAPLTVALVANLPREIIEYLILHYAGVFRDDAEDLQRNCPQEYPVWLDQRRAQCYAWLQSQDIPTDLWKLLFEFVSEV